MLQNHGELLCEWKHGVLRYKMFQEPLQLKRMFFKHQNIEFHFEKVVCKILITIDRNRFYRNRSI